MGPSWIYSASWQKEPHASCKKQDVIPQCDHPSTEIWIYLKAFITAKDNFSHRKHWEQRTASSSSGKHPEFSSFFTAPRASQMELPASRNKWNRLEPALALGRTGSTQLVSASQPPKYSSVHVIGSRVFGSRPTSPELYWGVACSASSGLNSNEVIFRHFSDSWLDQNISVLHAAALAQLVWKVYKADLRVWHSTWVMKNVPISIISPEQDSALTWILHCSSLK